MLRVRRCRRLTQQSLPDGPLRPYLGRTCTDRASIQSPRRRATGTTRGSSVTASNPSLRISNWQWSRHKQEIAYRIAQNATHNELRKRLKQSKVRAPVPAASSRPQGATASTCAFSVPSALRCQSGNCRVSCPSLPVPRSIVVSRRRSKSKLLCPD
jgi:hypothetical protein